ncbi:hypothetical protein CTAYLR_000529 [Chrysophaeum taylorii]|uniref:Plastid lipid-associated protein/fibrillin conserved domain-containing protein n=1 Tax=Chrysophaeum taylorii TaxID=2483200 RepID=A0AAD7UIE9_9STRA|nr:hypothetical protein CTAYLR_000529 [Chrysophaeum taylorii]
MLVCVLLVQEIATVKRKVLGLCAGCDRGFGASGADRANVEDAIEELCGLRDPEPLEALRKRWRLVYTSAPDVSTLAGNPLVQLGGIYQDATEWPRIVNVIDASPRWLSLAPPALGSAVEIIGRQKVITTATPKTETRVALTFERVEVAPLRFFGAQVPDIFTLGVPLPPASGEFDVRYLDDDFLVIQQQAPGGIFVATA